MSTAFPNEPTGATNLLDHAFDNMTGLDDVYAMATIETDATAPLSPSKVMRSRLPARAATGGTQIGYALGAVYDDMFVGKWWRCNAEFQGRTAADKMFFMRGPDSNGFFGMLGGPTKGGTPFIYFCHNSGNVDNSHTMASHLGLVGYPNVGNGQVVYGQWTKIEAYIKRSTTLTSRDGIVRWWVNGALTGNYTDVNYAPSGFNEWVWAETWDGCGTNGAAGCDLGPLTGKNTVEWVHYLDHLYISVGGTGSGGSSGGGTPAVLPAPSNLYPNGVTLPYGSTNFSWNAVPGAAQYAVRIHKVGQPYEPEASFPYFATQGAASVFVQTDADSQYDWWVHAVDGSGELGPSSGALLTTSGSAEPPPPDPDPEPDPPTDPPVDPPPVVPPPVVDPPVTEPPTELPPPAITGRVSITVTIKDRLNPIKKEYEFYG